MSNNCEFLYSGNVRLRPGTRRTGIIVTIACGCILAAVAQSRFGRVWQKYEPEMQDPVEDPPDVGRKAEFTTGRLRYRSPRDGRFYSRWGIDANKGDRLFINLTSRLTRVDAAPVEYIVDVGSDEIFNYPWMVAISAGDWQLTPSESARLKEYFARGGFLLVDDFHNEREWAQFMYGLREADPSVQAEELADDDPAFHTVYNLGHRFRVPGANVVHGSQIERGGTTPHWRAIRDARGRMVIALNFNQDMGDGWEFADDPEYPEKYSSMAIRLGIDYLVYAMTH